MTGKPTSGDEAVAAPAQSAYERWELPAVKGLDARAGSGGRLTAARLEDIEEQARAEGFAEGRESGFAEGRRDGLKAGEAEARERVQRFDQLVTCLAVPLEQLDEAVEDTLVGLAMSVARQLVYRELSADPALVLEAVRAAVAALPEPDAPVRVELNPEDAARVRELREPGAGETRWSLLEDAGLPCGGCRVSAGSSRIDASVEARLASVIAHVLGGRTDNEHGAGD